MIKIEAKDELIKILRADIEQLHKDIRTYIDACANLNAENTYLKGACDELKKELARTSFNEDVLRREYNRMQKERLESEGVDD